jgi:hypothetical protein
MTIESLSSLRQIPDDALVARLRTLHGRSCEITARLVVHIYEMRRRKLHLDLGYSSMFDYCTKELHMSQGQTMRLLNAADIARICPEVLDMIRRGEVHLTGLSELKPHVRSKNVDELLAMARHRSKRSIQEELARRFPRRAPRSEIRLVRSDLEGGETTLGSLGSSWVAAPGHAASELPGGSPMTITPASADQGPQSVGGLDREHALAVLAEARAAGALHAEPTPNPPAYTRPVAADVYKVTFGAFTEKLGWATDLMRHRNSSGDMEAVLDAALDALIEELLKKKFAKTDQARAPKARASSSRAIPAAVKRAVVERDGYQCSYVSPDGIRCGCRAFLEFEHRMPVAKGGEHSTENVAIFCRPHNQRAADHEFGESFMNEKRYRRAMDRVWNTSGEVREAAVSVSPVLIGRDDLNVGPGAGSAGLSTVAGDGEVERVRGREGVRGTGLAPLETSGRRGGLPSIARVGRSARKGPHAKKGSRRVEAQTSTSRGASHEYEGRMRMVGGPQRKLRAGAQAECG